MPVRSVAVLTFWDPWEAPHGGTLRTRAFCQAFAELGLDVTCVHPASPSSEAGTVDGVRRLPVAGQTVGHQRWPAVLQRAKRALLPMPTAVGARSPSLAAAVAGLPGVDLLVVGHLAAAQYHDVVPAARLWLDQSDLWSEFAQREAQARRGAARATASWQQRSIVGREATAARAAGAVTAAGWADADTLRQRTGRDVHWLPTSLPDADDHGPDRSDDVPAIGYLANFAYHPNVDALGVLVDHWLPGLRAQGWRLVVAGLRSDELELPDDVEVLGPVAHVDDFYARVDATAAPVRLGGGMKVKVIESLLKGRPVVATDFAVEGFPPAVRSLSTVVGLDRPALPAPADLPPVAVPDDVRHRFSPGGFTDVVRSVLDRLG